MAKTKTATKSRTTGSAKAGSFRSFRSALNFLGTVTDYESQRRVSYNQNMFNLSRMNRLLGSLGNPQKKIKTVHIAGTKGKGSTAAMISNMLQGCGYNIGVYSSPHVLDVRERITLNDTWISEQEFVKLVNKIAPFVRSATAANKPTFFELLTAMAFQHFADKEVDLAIVEAGLGGRLDCTNVIKPEVCGITSISLDHTNLLGNDIKDIAREKAGILKAGIPAVSAPQPDAVSKVLKEVAGEKGAELKFTGHDIEFSYRFESSRHFGPHTRVCLTTTTSRFEHLHVPLQGEHQAVNCGLALSLLDVLKHRGFDIADQKAIEGLSQVDLPGRMETVMTNPRVIIDGAHNAASIEALMRTIGQNVSYDSMIVVFGCQQGKDIEGMVRHVQLGADKVIFTKSDAPNAVDPQDLAASYQEQSGNMAQTAESLEDALRIAQGAITTEDVICITGSFYLVGQAKKLLS